MARSPKTKVTYEAVREAAESLRAAGRQATNRGVQALIGGSFREVAPLMRQWRDTQEDAAPSPPKAKFLNEDETARVADILDQVFVSAHQRARSAEEVLWRTRLGEAEARAAEADTEYAEAERRAEALRLELASAREAHEERVTLLERNLSGEQREAAGLRAQIERAEAALGTVRQEAAARREELAEVKQRESDVRKRLQGEVQSARTACKKAEQQAAEVTERWQREQEKHQEAACRLAVTAAQWEETKGAVRDLSAERNGLRQCVETERGAQEALRAEWAQDREAVARLSAELAAARQEIETRDAWLAQSERLQVRWQEERADLRDAAGALRREVARLEQALRDALAGKETGADAEA